MPAETDEKPMYAALVALKPEGLSLNGWAQKAGLARNYFSNLRAHGNPSGDTLQMLLDAIGKSMSDLGVVQGALTTNAQPTAIADVRTMFIGEGRGDLPVLGSAIGGSYDNLDEAVELTELHFTEVIDRIARPAVLANDMDAYALQIVGDSMFPRFKPGERVSVSPRAPVGIGDDVIVQLVGLEGDEERVKTVLIKELVRRTGAYVELRQYNPDITFRIEAKHVARMHRVKSNYF